MRQIIWQYIRACAFQDMKRYIQWFVENDTAYNDQLEEKVYVIINQKPRESAEPLQEKIAALEGQIADLQKELIQLREKSKENIRQSQLQQRIKALEDIAKKQSERIDLYEKQNCQLYKTLEALEEKINQQAQKNQSLELNVSEQAVPAQPEEDSLLTAFQIENRRNLLLSGNAEAIKNELQPVLHIKPILDYLKQSDFEQKAIYIKMFDKLKNDVEKFIDTLVIDSDDDVFENVTEAFFKIIKKDLLSTLMVAIRRGMNIEKDRPFYVQLLELINTYLRSCCIYTEKIEEGIKYTDAILDKMEPLRKPTSDIAKDKEIEEIERLPYCIDFFNEDGERESMCYEGQCVILKYEE